MTFFHTIKKLLSILCFTLFIFVFISIIFIDLKKPTEQYDITGYSYQFLQSSSVDALKDTWISIDKPYLPTPESGMNFYAMRFKTSQSNLRLFNIPQVFSDAFTLYDQNLNALYQWHTESPYEMYSYLVNMVTIPVEGDTFYLIAESTDGIPFIGINITTEMISLKSKLLGADLRLAISFLLIVVAIFLLVMSVIIKNPQIVVYLKNTAYFTGIFGVWAIFDFHRHSFWIRENFSIVPIWVLIIIYIISADTMIPLFLKLNKTLLKRTMFSFALHYLTIWSWMIAGIGIFMEIFRFFYWSATINKLYGIYFMFLDGTVAIGSIILIIITLFSLYRKDLKSVLYSIGLSGCLVTFIISQTTPLLISHWGVLWLLIFIIGVMAISFVESQNSNKTYMLRLEEMNQSITNLNDELNYTQKELLLRLGSTVDLKSKETSEHVQKVSDITEFIALKMDFAPEEAKIIALASTLHDIGKVGIPDDILNSTTTLTPEEYEVMKLHANMGYNILNGASSTLMDYAAIIAWTHHEKYDGTGYPNQLSGDDIPLIGAIVAAADVMDALLSKRVYKRAWSYDEVYTYFIEQRGKHFHPKVADIVIEHYEEIKQLSKDFV